MRAASVFLSALGMAGLLSGCSRKSETPAPSTADSARAATADSGRAASAANSAAAPNASSRFVVLFLGDSLTAGYGVAGDEAYPALLAERWRKEGVPVEVRTAGVSGRTTAGGLEGLDWALTPEVRVLFLELGVNDGLRGSALGPAEKNLSAIIEKARARGVRVALAGMRLPPNYGADYSRRFEAMYRALARRYRVAFLPFLLEGVGGRPDLNGPDGIHPNAAGHRIVAEHVHDFFAREHLLP